MDKRRFSRIPFKVDVTVAWGATTVAAQTVDLSLGGVYITASLKIPLHERVDVRITVPKNVSPNSLTASALVVRQDDEGIGLVFTGMDFDSFFTLTQLVSQGLGDRNRSAREVLDFLSHPPGDE